MKDKTIFMVGNGHIDPVWQWQWPEGMQEVHATFRSALDRMKEYPEFKFTASSAAFYEWVEKGDPKMFAEIKERVAEGRWEVVGGWWVEPDCNIPNGESFVRHSLYSQRWFEEKLGRMAVVGYNPDSFGHNAMLPQILRKSGMDSYVFMRPNPAEKWLPDRTFWWEAPDGSRVLAFRIRGEYGTWPKDLDEHVRQGASALQPPLDAIMLFYGVGNHGGGPTKLNIESIKRMDADPQYPRLVFATTSEYLARARSSRAKFPVVRDDLQHHARGCYAAHSGVKKWNRRAENVLIAGEKMATLAARLVGRAYPCGVRDAWKRVLFNQFHDVLAGTSIESAYDDVRDELGEATAVGSRTLYESVQALSWRIGIPAKEGTRAIVVANPHAHPVRALVELESGGVKDTDGLTDEAGAPLAMQEVRSEATVTHWRKRLAFVADLPPLGHRVHFVVPDARIAGVPCDATDTAIESASFRLEVDRATGTIARLHDKRAGRDVFSARAGRAVVVNDKSDTWSHGTARFHDVAGEFGDASCRLVEHGPVRSVIRTESRFGTSQLVQEFSLSPSLDRVVVKVGVDWREKQCALKLRFPVAVRDPHATFEIPYGHFVRVASGDEEPGQAWIDVTGRLDDDALYGVSILNDAKYSYDVLGADMALTVLRSPISSHHDPYVPREGERYVYLDQGAQRFTYVIVPHEGRWQDAGIPRAALELLQPPVAMFESAHVGAFPLKASGASVEPANVTMTVLKQAEDGSGDVIARCVETAGAATDATVALHAWGRTIHARFGPSEIKTFRVPSSGDPYETDLLERRV